MHVQTRYLYLLRSVLAISDLLVINFCFIISCYLTNKYFQQISFSSYKHLIVTSNIVWLLSSSVFSLYSEVTVHKLLFIYRATWKSVLLFITVFLFYLFFTDSEISKYFITIFYLFTVTSFILSRFTGTAFEDVLQRNFAIKKPVAILGLNNGGLKLASYLEESDNFNFAGFLGEESFYVDESGELLPSTSIELQKAANSGIKDVFVSLTPDRMGEVKNLLFEAEKNCLRLKFVPDFSYTAAPFNIEHMGSFPIISVRKEPLESLQSRFRKRFFDIVFSSLIIVFVLSWLYPLLAFIIKMQSPGPVLFKQMRSGRNNVPFVCYKFRSMRMNNKDEKKQATRDDDRITKIGRFMRKTSLDELPQFFNVLIGNMSICGPRPHMLDHTEEYRAIIDQYMVRHFLKPGISGWAQVNGFRGETKEKHLMEKRVEHDIWYMENWSSMLDIKIIFMTIINVFKGEDTAY